MTRRPFSALLICSAMLCAAPLGFAPMSGCALVEDSPRGKYFQANEFVIEAVATLIQLQADGLISPEVYVEKVNPAIQRANAALDLWELAVATGDDGQQVSVNATLQLILTELRTYIANANRGA